jgi:diguanylate cyclase
LDLSNVTAASQEKSREQSNPARRARVGALLPLCIFVAFAILCIVVAAFTSAQRANEVAIEHEKELLVKAIANRAESSLRKLRFVTDSDAPDEQPAAANLDLVLQRVGVGLKAVIDHDYVVVVDGFGRLAHSFIKRNTLEADWLSAALPELAPTLAHLQGESRTAPGKAMWLSNPHPSAHNTFVPEAAFLHSMRDRVAIVTSIVTGGKDNAGNQSPIVLTIQIIDEIFLADVGNRLLLANLRKTGEDDIPADDHVFTIRDLHDQPITQFAWTPRRPGAAVLRNVIPYLAITIVGFALLAAFALRYMRVSAAAIAAGENRLRFLALHDPLCGLPNRVFFSEQLELKIAQVRRGGPPAAVLYLDLDHFKDVNDTLGHSIGDELIRNVTQRLKHTLRSDDIVARLGGDEFAVITTAASDHDMLQLIAQRVIASLCTPYMVDGNTIVIGVSIGIAIVEQNSKERGSDIMRFADIALFRAKSEGRNRACIYNAEMDAELTRRTQLEKDLRAAIATDELSVAYQPVVSASGEKIVGVEALARWLHPERGYLSPAEFIPLAEQSGLIIELGEWVLRRACRDGRAWPKLSMAVNVSPVQFRQAGFVETIERVLAETEFDATRLELEVTESTLIGNVEIAEAAMLRLKALGVRLALDDFGTGYSSLQYLRRFPFDKLKIDRSFIQSIEKAADAAAIVHAIVSLGRGLGMKVTAEGVENAEQHLFLRAAGVHFMQGFRFGKPCSAAEIGALLKLPGAYRGMERDAVAAMAG